MAARLLLLAVLVWDCSALLLGAGTPRHFVARDTVKRRGATVQMDLSSLVSDHPLAAIAVTAAISSAAGTALGVSAIPSRASPVATVAAYSKIEDEAKYTEVCPHACVMSHGPREPVDLPAGRANCELVVVTCAGIVVGL